MKQLAKKLIYAPLSLLLSISPAMAGSIIDKAIPCQGEGNCQLSHLIQVVINVAQWIWGISGSLALLMFIYGGFMFLISGGQSEKITKAKGIISNSLIGLVIIFTSYVIVGFVVQNLLGIKGDWFRAGGIFSN